MADYPKIKYQGVEIKPGQHHTENPGYIYQKVNTAEEEAGLEGEWHDTPRAAIESFKGQAKTREEQSKGELQQTQARERGIPPAGADTLGGQSEGGGGAGAMPKDDKKDPGHAGTHHGAGDEHPRKTAEWPTESEKRKGK